MRDVQALRRHYQVASRTNRPRQHVGNAAVRGAFTTTSALSGGGARSTPNAVVVRSTHSQSPKLLVRVERPVGKGCQEVALQRPSGSNDAEMGRRKNSTNGLGSAGKEKKDPSLSLMVGDLNCTVFTRPLFTRGSEVLLQLSPQGSGLSALRRILVTTTPSAQIKTLRPATRDTDSRPDRSEACHRTGPLIVCIVTFGCNKALPVESRPPGPRHTLGDDFPPKFTDETRQRGRFVVTRRRHDHA